MKKMCAHCDERQRGAEGTIWCAECLEWYREEFMKRWPCVRCGVTGKLNKENLCEECQQ